MKQDLQIYFNKEITQQKPVYIALYYRSAASAKSYSYIGLCPYFVPPDRPMILD